MVRYLNFPFKFLKNKIITRSDIAYYILHLQHDTQVAAFFHIFV